ncbi:MAG: hypothetical protein ACK58T_35275, partial [Phycisphaerae bacterium]|jgi:hypothetical protein
MNGDLSQKLANLPTENGRHDTLVLVDCLICGHLFLVFVVPDCFVCSQVGGWRLRKVAPCFAIDSSFQAMDLQSTVREASLWMGMTLDSGIVRVS